MANGIINMSELSSGIAEKLVASVSPLVTIFKVVGAAVLVYIIFLIIKALFRWRTMSKVGKISKNVVQINDKLDVLIRKLEVRPVAGKKDKEKGEIKKKKGKK